MLEPSPMTRSGWVPIVMLLLTGACGGGEDSDPGGSGGTGGATTGGGGGTLGGTGGGTTTGGGGMTGGTSTGGTGGIPGYIGAPCTQDTDCASLAGTQLMCRTDWPGGYCTTSCANDSWCIATETVSSCIEVGDPAESVCLADCGTCREGYTCSPVFPFTYCIPTSLLP